MFNSKNKYLTMFFVFGFFSMGGVAGQGVNLYLFGMILPLIFFSRDQLYPQNPNIFFLLAVGFLLLWLSFPVASLVNYATIDKSIIPESFKFSKVFQSRLSSGFLGTSIGLLISAFVFSRLKQNSSAKPLTLPNSEDLFLAFSVAILIGAVLTFVYSLIQHKTGFDYRMPDYSLGTKKLMGEGKYRAIGFYRHSLSLASVCLALFVFYWSLIWKFLANGQRNLFFVGLFICLLSLGSLFLSGSRFSILVASFFLVITLAKSPVRASHRSLRKWIFALFFLGGGGLLLSTGLLNRFHEIFTRIEKGDFNDPRLVFWKIHWQMFLDSPIFGQGYAMIDSFVRDLYYEKTGFGEFSSKFNAHNIYLETLACAGIFGVSMIALGGRLICTSLHNLVNHHVFSQTIFSSLFLAIAANFIHGLAQNTMFDSNVTYIYLTIFLMLLWIRLISEVQAVDKKHSAQPSSL